MRIANLAGRAVLLSGDGALDIAEASGGRLPSDPQTLFDHWDALRSLNPSGEAVPVNEHLLGACAPGPGQVFAIGVNYTDRAAEARVDMAVRLPDRAGCHRRAAA